MRKRENMVEKGSQEYDERQVSMSRGAILLVLCLTVVNLGLLIAGSNTYLLFAASAPYYLTIMARGFDLAASGAVNGGLYLGGPGFQRPGAGALPALLASE